MKRGMTSERGGKGICLQLTKSLMMFCKFVFYILTSHLQFLVVGRTRNIRFFVRTNDSDHSTVYPTM
jgi:hypothetical protein